MAKVSKKSLIIDSVSLLSPFIGIARYTYEVSKIIKDKDKLNLYFNYLYPSKKLMSDKKKGGAKSVRNFLIKNRYLKRYSRRLINSLNTVFPKTYDLYWQPNIIPNPNIKSKKLIITLHDFSFLLYPESHPEERLEYIDKNFKKGIEKADHIITGSNYTKSEAIKYLNLQSRDITVIYHAVDHNLFKVYPKEKLISTQKEYALPQNFILSVGSIEPRKNLISLLEAYTELDIKFQKRYPLVLIGAKGWKNRKIIQKIENSNHIKYLGYV